MGIRGFCRDCISPLSIFAVVSILSGIVVAWIALAKNPHGIAGGLATEAVGVLVGTGLIEAALAGVQRARTRQDQARSVGIHASNEHLSADGQRVWCDLMAPNRYNTLVYNLVLTFNVPVELTPIMRPNARSIEPHEQTLFAGERVKLEANEFHHIGLLGSGQTLFYEIAYSADDTFPQFVLTWSLPVPTDRPVGAHQRYNGFLPTGDSLKNAERPVTAPHR